ncbi:IS66 family insertion sequence element accessory protein TnpB [Bradyrhizobium cosmicum]|uniref:IS66 family insertion sequence element accessory protein TnpB n=1 Tax=Bradyrhizobium cosmicum TaxID=1404864 RepID=UPI0039657CB8
MLRKDPLSGHLFVFRGSPQRSCEDDLARWPGSMPVYQKLERGRFIWPSVAGESVTISRRS